jgi:uncharacterized protein
VIDDIPVIDAVVHAYNMDSSNYQADFAETVCDIVYETVIAAARPGLRPHKEDYLVDWTMEEVANMLFLESSTDLAVNHVLPVFAFKDGLCSVEKAQEAEERWPDRFITYCGVDPLTGDAGMEEMERQIEMLAPVGLKLYPNSWVTDEIRGWKMDDPEIAFPFFARAQELGVKVIAVHKAVPLGPAPLEHYRVDDIDRAAIAFPELMFEVIHGGMAFIEESAWQLARFANVYVNLEITTSLLGTRPLAFAQALGGLVSVGGDAAIEKILWGTGTIAYHPQPFIETFVRDFQFSDEQLALGIPELTTEHKSKILAANYARMIGLDLDAQLAKVRGDELDQRRGDGLLEPFSTTHVAGRVI